VEKEEIKMRIAELEAAMQAPDFWSEPQKAQAMIKELQDLKAEAEGGSKYDQGSAVLSLVAGAGGDDAEDFAHMLFEMYRKFIEARGWGYKLLHENQNDHGGYRNISIEIEGKRAYGTLKNEYGVHRLVRISPTAGVWWRAPEATTSKTSPTCFLKCIASLLRLAVGATSYSTKIKTTMAAIAIFLSR
jgi:peptide chain release factor 2